MARGPREDGFRSPALSASLDRAIAGDPRELYDLLCRASGLPGVRANMNVVNAFAAECASRAPRADKIANTMATLDPDRAPGGMAHEILPMCGVAAIGMRGATDPTFLQRALEGLHAAADDLRFRVRETVPRALAKIGARQGDALVPMLAPWMDGYFHAAAVLLALGDPDWLTTLTNADEVIARLDEAFVLAKNAERAAERYPGYKALVEALSKTPGAVAIRFGVPVFDRMAAWSNVKEPMLRDAITANLASTRIAGRFAAEAARVRQALGTSAPVPRDPTLKVQGMRSRGKKRSAR